MSDRTRDLLVHGIAAVKGNSKAEARHYLEWVIEAPDSNADEIADAWRYLADIEDDPKKKRECLDHSLALNPMDPEARRELAILNGQLKPEEIVNPDHLPAPMPADAAQPRRYVCAQCGGKMAYSPDGTTLTCAYCGRRQSLANVKDDSVLLEEQNFTVALATAKGHTKPTAQRSLKCQGCSASFVLSPETLSITCPYCASAYVVEQTETRILIEPEGIVPFAVPREEALKKLLGWFRAEKFSLRGNPVPPNGVYLPIWTFDIGGEVLWNCMQEEDAMWTPNAGNLLARHTKVWVPASGSRMIYENDLLVPASHSLSAPLIAALSTFPLERLTPYDPRYLVDWPAETYQVAVGDASLVARWRILDRERRVIVDTLFKPYKDLQVSATRVVIESFKLILLPVWIARYTIDKKNYALVINGQTGELRAEKPAQGIGKLFSALLGD